MSAASLEAAFRNAEQFHKAPSRERRAKDPMGMLLGGSVPYGDMDYGGDHENDQYAHYRGRFYAVSRLICARLATQPVLVGRYGGTNRKNFVSSLKKKGRLPPGSYPDWLSTGPEIEVLTSHPLRTALDDPNRYHTPHEFWTMVGGSLMATGRGFIVLIESERKDRAWDLFPLPATWLRPDHSKGPFAEWKVSPPGVGTGSITISGKQVVPIRMADPASLIGVLSPLSMAAKSVLVDEAILNTQYSEFKNEAMPKVALIAGDVMNETGFTDDPNRTSAARPVRLEPEQRRQIINWFQQQYAGAKKRGLPIVLDAIIRDIKILSRSPEEMGYIGSSGLSKEQIYEIAGASEILNGKLDGVTRASGALAEQFFMDNCFNPFLKNISEAMIKHMCPMFAINGERLVAWVAPGVYRDAELDMEFLRMAVRSYSATRNDVRAVMRSRFTGFEEVDGMDDVIIPEKLEERVPEEDRLGVGRLGAEAAAIDGENGA